jgi:hypothetical protein
MARQVKRIWHKYTDWEDFKAGMYRRAALEESKPLLDRCILLMNDTQSFGEWMLRVLSEWSVAAEHNLTDEQQNRQAWLGQAACCLAIQCPEHLTREAWGAISELKRRAANEQADSVIADYLEQCETKNTGVYLQMEIAGLSRRDTRRSSATLGRFESSPVLSADLSGNSEKRLSVGVAGIFPPEVSSIHGTQAAGID